MPSSDLISKNTRTEFRELLVGSTWRELSDTFEAAGLKSDISFIPSVIGQRRSLVEQYYKLLNLASPADLQELLQVFESILTAALVRINNPATLRGDVGQYRQSVNTTLARLKNDGYELVNGRLAPFSHATTLKHVKAKATTFHAEYLTAQIQRLDTAVTADPDLAIGRAEELIKTCCKTILAEHGIEEVDKLDVQPLARRQLRY